MVSAMAVATCLFVQQPFSTKWKTLYLLVHLSLEISSIVSVEVLRPRGVALTKKVFYDVSKEHFTCLDGSLTLPFHYVNDDYCDCEDGTDEPGTAACPNGVFHCTNAGHKPLNIPSSRVNDGICDCCDASDEYNSSAECLNHCKELGRKAKEEAQRQLELQSKGIEMKREYSRQGQELVEERKNKLEELEKEKNDLMQAKEEKEVAKKAAEEMEKDALDKYRNEEEERKQAQDAQRLEEEREEQAVAAFEDLDINSDGKLSVEEIQSRWVFDQNKDGQVSIEEAKFFLLNREEIDLDEFKKTGWTMMKPHYSLQKMFKPPGEGEESTDMPLSQDIPVTETDTQAITEGSDQETLNDLDEVPLDEGRPDEEDEEEEEEDSDLVNPPKFPNPEIGNSEKPSEEPSPQYDEETQGLIDQANKARAEYDEVDKKFRDLENEITKVRKLTEIDFGPELEFAPLYGQCMEYTDREYTYKLCPFDQATQQQKGGGGETNLGTWGLWHGAEENKYAKMMYNNGLTCWNGPSRSVEAVLSCGLENKIVSVTEPSRCIYTFEVVTPAACNHFSKQPEIHAHDEF